MPIEQLVLPTLATVALGTALLVPLRDERRGKRATLAGAAPLRTEFSVIDGDRATSSPGLLEEDRSPDVPAMTNDVRDEDARNAALDVLTHSSLPPTSSVASRSDMRAHVASLATTIARALGFGSPAREKASENDAGVTAVSSDVAGDAHTRSGERNGPPQPSFTGVLQRLMQASQPPAPDAATSDEPQTRLSTVIETQVTEPADVPPSIIASQAPIVERMHPDDSALGPSISAPRAPFVDRPLHDGSQLAPSVSASQAPLVDRTPSHDSAPIVIRAQRPTVERVVPLTRLPLRPQTTTITWPALLPPGSVDTGALVRDRSGRHAVLVDLLRTAHDDDATHVLRVAYLEEDSEGRLLALRALGRTTIDDATHTIMLDALRAGSDDERSLALDIAARTGDRDALRCALTDRIDAIAARAALAFVDSFDRDDYVAMLSPHVEPARLETILGLLAGVVE